MSEESIEELFGEGSGQPVPRMGLAAGLLLGGVALAIVGMLCTSVPGGVMVLVAWVVIEKELDRIESGYLSTEFRPRLRALLIATYVGVLLVIGLFTAQMILLCSGAYEELWGRAASFIWGG